MVRELTYCVEQVGSRGEGRWGEIGGCRGDCGKSILRVC